MFFEYMYRYTLDDLDWTPYVVTTEDGWEITVFRVFSTDVNLQETMSDTRPVIFQNGSNGVAADWIFSWASRLARSGYDVWLTS